MYSGRKWDQYCQLYVMCCFYYLVIKMSTILDQIRANEIGNLAKFSDRSKTLEWEMISQFQTECEQNVILNKKYYYKIFICWLLAAVYLVVDDVLKSNYDDEESLKTDNEMTRFTMEIIVFVRTVCRLI